MTKKAITSIAALLAVIMCITLTSCEADDRYYRDESDFFGKWYSRSDGGYYLTTITLYSDGYGVIEDWEGDYRTGYDEFEWDVSSHYINVYYTYDGSMERWRYKFINYDRMRIDFGRGNYAYFTHM